MLRRTLSLSLAALVAAASAVASSSAAVARVSAVQEGRVADLVVVGSGFEAGFRRGMVCRVTRGNVEIGELLLVDLRPSCSAALILSLAPKQAINVGDAVAIKVLKS
jgi:hypothetical protein